MGKNDIEVMENQIVDIEKEAAKAIARVSRAPQHMTTSEFVILSDEKRRELIRIEINLYCERDNKIREIRKEINKIKELNRLSN